MHAQNAILPFQNGVCGQYYIEFLEYIDIGFARTSVPNKDLEAISMGRYFVPPLHNCHRRSIIRRDRSDHIG